MKPNRIRVAQLSIALALAALGNSAVAQEKAASEPLKPAAVADKAAPASPAPQAQAPSPNQAPSAAKQAPSGAAVEPAAETAPKAPAIGELNPFTGQRQAAEQSKRQAEEVRAQNQLLEERIRQAALMSDLQNTPLRKQMELQKLIDQNRPPAPAAPPAAAPSPAKDVAVEPAKKAVPKADSAKKPAAAKPVATVATPAPAVLKPPAPELVGVIRTKDGVTAIVSNEGRTILARPGEQTSLGRVDEVTQDTARIGADKLVYRANRAARVALTDTPPATAAAPSAAQPKNVALPPAPPYQSGLQLPQVPGVPPSGSGRDVAFK